MLEANLRLDPFAPDVGWSGCKGCANYMLRRYVEAVALLREWTSRQRDMLLPRHWLASAYAQLGQIKEARAEAAEVLRIYPGFTIEKWKRLAAFKYPKDFEHRLEGMRKAGLPEG